MSTICYLPWIFQAVRNNGHVRVCCQANQGPDRGLIRKDDGTIYNAATDNLDEARNAKKMKDIRKDMINGKWHPDCIRCEKEEASGIRSRLTYEKELWQHYISEDEIIKRTSDDGSIDIDKMPVVYYDLRFGNLCNLKCRICSPTDSDAWYEEHFKMGKTGFNDTTGRLQIIESNGKYKLTTPTFTWYESEYFWNYMKEKIPHILHVHTVGGEPLLIKQHFKFLEKCIESNQSQNMRIEYNSNITVLSDKILELWKSFKMIAIGASVDSIYKINDYIRYPSKWSLVENNLLKLDNSPDNIRIWIACTVSIYNILYLPKMFEWKVKQNFNKVNNNNWQSLMSTHPLHAPHFLNIKVLPIEVKEKIKEYFKNYEFDDSFNKYQLKEAKTLLEKYTNFMVQEDYSHMLNEFWDFNNKVDALREETLEDNLPELYSLIKHTKDQ